VKRVVTTKDLVVLLKKASTLWKAAEAAQRMSTDLDLNKENIKVAEGAIRYGQKQLRQANLTTRRRGKIERRIEYHQELLACTEAECEQKIPEFSEALAQVEMVLSDLADIHENLATVPRFEHR
jgi:hypothetical protein